MGANRRIRNAIASGVECKMQGICTATELVNKALNIQLEARERMFQTLDEINREDAEIPRCPPDCDKDDEVVIIEQTQVKRK